MSGFRSRIEQAEVVKGIGRWLFPSQQHRQIALTADELFFLLADSRRRAVINEFANRSDRAPISVSTLARHIAGNETHMAAELVPEERVEPVASELRLTHLPLLSGTGIISCDEEELTAGHALEPAAGALEDCSQYVKQEPPHQRERYR